MNAPCIEAIDAVNVTFSSASDWYHSCTFDVLGSNDSYLTGCRTDLVI